MTAAKDLRGSVALVTGGARNIGRAIALELAEAGAHVAILTRTDADGADAVARQAREHGVEAERYLADVTDEAAVRRTAAEIGARFGRLDILVNNAAVRNELPFAAMTLDQWRDVLAVTLDGAFLCTHAALPLLEASGRGAIVNIGGLTAYTGAAERAHVVTAKAGLGGFTRALATELAARNITVNLVAPGLIQTVRDGVVPRHRRTRQTLAGRRGLPEDVAAMVCYLAGPRARFVTGQTMHVNGGAYLG